MLNPLEPLKILQQLILAKKARALTLRKKNLKMTSKHQINRQRNGNGPFNQKKTTTKDQTIPLPIISSLLRKILSSFLIKILHHKMNIKIFQL